MDIYQKKSRWKWYLGIAGGLIILFSMFYTKFLADRLAEEEVKKIELLKEAYDQLNISPDDPAALNCDFTFYLNFFDGNTSVPLVMVTPDGHLEGKNYGTEADTNQVFLKQKIEGFMASGNLPRIITTPIGDIELYFEHSRILTLLKYYPFLQLILVGAFILLGYLAFSAARRGEQNRVWAGMAKETAHQLGTPISGIIAWIEHLRMMKEGDGEVGEVLDEMHSDVMRLNLVADRFSKIGSAPELKEIDIYEELESCRAYMQRRAPRKVEFDFPPSNGGPLPVNINSHLFDWVVENLLRNAIDAMEKGQGKISAKIYEDEKYVNVDISDTGKGIPAGKFKSVFKPGYSTKKRGWGLGLSLAKRIIEDYHSGKIFVKKSAVGEGATFTIQLPKKVGS